MLLVNLTRESITYARPRGFGSSNNDTFTVIIKVIRPLISRSVRSSSRLRFERNCRNYLVQLPASRRNDRANHPRAIATLHRPWNVRCIFILREANFVFVQRSSAPHISIANSLAARWLNLFIVQIATLETHRKFNLSIKSEIRIPSFD